MGTGMVSYKTELKWTEWTSLCYRRTPEGSEGRSEHISSLYANDRFLMDFCDNILLHTDMSISLRASVIHRANILFLLLSYCQSLSPNFKMELPVS